MDKDKETSAKSQNTICFTGSCALAILLEVTWPFKPTGLDHPPNGLCDSCANVGAGRDCLCCFLLALLIIASTTLPCQETEAVEIGRSAMQSSRGSLQGGIVMGGSFMVFSIGTVSYS